MARREGAPYMERAPDTLTPGRNGLGKDRVSEIQRTRMLAAMTETVAERGVSNTTVAHVVARSHVSRRTFYEMFSDGEGCFLAAFDDGIARASRHVLEAYDPSARWAGRIRSALTGLLSFFDAERGMGRLLVVESLAAGPGGLERRRRVLGQIIDRIDEGRSEAKSSTAPPPLTAEGVVGAVFSVVHARLLAQPTVLLAGLVNELMGIIVLPYLGTAATSRELARPLPKSQAPVHRASNDPLRELEMRLTYRTVRVLNAVAAQPGASNRQMADEAGISDQGQISKLLARLERLGLIRNTRAGSGRGEPNAWALTERGFELHGAIHA
jgi:AcrR family transcriptional regulator